MKTFTVLTLVCLLPLLAWARPQYVTHNAPPTGPKWPPYEGAGEGYWSSLAKKEEAQVKEDTIDLTEHSVDDGKSVNKKDILKHPHTQVQKENKDQKSQTTTKVKRSSLAKKNEAQRKEDIIDLTEHSVDDGRRVVKKDLKDPQPQVGKRNKDQKSPTAAKVKRSSLAKKDEAMRKEDLIDLTEHSVDDGRRVVKKDLKHPQPQDRRRNKDQKSPTAAKVKRSSLAKKDEAKRKEDIIDLTEHSVDDGKRVVKKDLKHPHPQDGKRKKSQKSPTAAKVRQRPVKNQ